MICPICKTPFSPLHSRQRFCRPECTVQWQQAEAKRRRAETRAASGRAPVIRRLPRGYKPKTSNVLDPADLRQLYINREIDNKYAGGGGDPGRRIVGEEFKRLVEFYQARP